ncbi:MAG TPA: peptide chain release factor N(5)-glutamine methyltransferase [Acidimicrobiia bacterium]|nr:peptide chain release factor N(5)-glutamine methyltransferase [Acidimicrobiia bacterium]
MATWRELRVSTEAALRDAGVDAPPSEARWMVERVSGFEGPELVMHEHDQATSLAVAHLDAMIERRRAGEPLQYVLGQWQFLDLELFVDRRVLVPRPETEVVARVATEEAVRLGLRHGPADPWSVGATEVVVDLGTGSGALALALASALPDAEVWAVDVSDDALAVARANVAGVGGPAATRVRIAHGSWFDALPDVLRGGIRLVVSNPPYIAESEVASLPNTVIEWEPYGALVSGPTGLEAIEVIVTDAVEWLAPDGVLVCELAPHQAEAASELARAAGFADVEVRADLAGRERALIARRAPAG